MINDYIEKAKKRQRVSQNKLAKMIGISGSALSHIVNGNKASEETIVAIARLCGENPEKVLADYKLSVGDLLKPEVKSMWERIAGTAAVLFIATSFGIATMTSTFSSALLAKNNVGNYILCKIAFFFENWLKPA